MSTLDKYLLDSKDGNGINLDSVKKASETFSISQYEVEIIALGLGIMPTRFVRNNLSCDEQLKLFQSSLSIIGCGGLGGTIAALLARIGVGKLRLVDPDVFEEHNLNRQRFCTINNINKSKVAETASSLKDINPTLVTTYFQRTFNEDDVIDSDLIMDGLDSGEKRNQLAEICEKHHKPMVHGAVREWYGQVGLAIAPNNLIKTLYPEKTKENANHCPPKVLAPTVNVIASIQVIEAMKLILGKKSNLENHWLFTDLSTLEFELIHL